MKVNGEDAHSGNTSAISNDPVNSVIQLVELLEENGHKLQTPCLVLAGAATPAISLEAGMNVYESVIITL